MGLHVGEFRAEQLLDPLNGQIFYEIDVFAAAVVPVTAVTFCVFIGKHTAGRSQDSFADDVFRCDKFDVALLAFQLQIAGREDLRIVLCKLVKEKHRFTILPNFVAVFIIWNNFSFVNVPYSQNSGVKGTMFY